MAAFLSIHSKEPRRRPQGTGAVAHDRYDGLVSIWSGSVAKAQITPDPKDWIGLGMRLVLGISLTYAGALKVGNLDGNIAQVELYELPVPQWANIVVGTSQPFLEIAVGLLLIVGLFTRVTAALGILAMVIFIAGISWAWSQGLRIDCGCFSPGGVLDEGEATRYLQDILRDLGLAATGVWLLVRPASVLAIDSVLLKPILDPDDTNLTSTEDIDNDEEDAS